MRSPEATSDLRWRLNDGALVARDFEELKELADAGGMVHPLAHQRENLIR